MNKIPTEILDIEYGKIVVLTTDINQTKAFRELKKAHDWQEVELLNSFLKDIERPIVFDIGANFGAFTLGLADTVKRNNGKIYTFEPQRILYNCLVASIALNGYDNIYTFNAAVGLSEKPAIEVPQFDYTRPCNFGSIEFGANQNERIEQARQFNPEKEYVDIYPVDAFINDIPRLDILKIDVEGMEDSVLLSAEEIIKKFKPILFVEFLKSDTNVLVDLFNKFGYTEISTFGVNFLCR